MKKKVIIGLSIFCSFIILVLTAFLIYVSTYYRALDEVEKYLESSLNVTVIEHDNYYSFEHKDATKGFIFYPGGLVEAISYAPLMHEIANNGYLCILIEMPFNLAVFDLNAADGIIEEYKNITDWYIGGHSLGGSMSASYLGKNKDDFSGLILLGSYSTSDFSDEDLKVLSIYGEYDEVLNKEKYEDNTKNLPEDFVEVVIDGGCHAYFGTYGKQKGDGDPKISNKEQITITVEAISSFISKE